MDFDLSEPHSLVGRSIEVISEPTTMPGEPVAGDIIVIKSYYTNLSGDYNYDVQVFHGGVDVTDQRSSKGKGWWYGYFEQQISAGRLKVLDHHAKGPAPAPNQPKNNDGRSMCAWCGAPTRDYGAVGGLPAVGQICTKCGK